MTLTHSLRRPIAAASLAFLALGAHAEAVSLTKLAGLTGGDLANTAVYRADLSTLGDGLIASLSISDVSGGFGGATGAFSGFDLDAVILSTTECATAACVKGLSAGSYLNYGATFLSAGSQRAPASPAGLFGTNASLSVNGAVATLDRFDGESTTAIPGAFGFVSLGDFGRLALNLSAPVSNQGLYLYIGEVGDNGEVAGSSIVLSSSPEVPEPATGALLFSGLVALGAWGRRQRRLPG